MNLATLSVCKVDETLTQTQIKGRLTYFAVVLPQHPIPTEKVYLAITHCIIANNTAPAQRGEELV